MTFFYQSFNFTFHDPPMGMNLKDFGCFQICKTLTSVKRRDFVVIKSCLYLATRSIKKNKNNKKSELHTFPTSFKAIICLSLLAPLILDLLIASVPTSLNFRTKFCVP